MKEEGLIRAVGFRGLTAGIINYTIGAGIFVLPALVAAKVGAAAPIVYVICAVAMGLIVLCFADAGSRVSLSGGAYAYAEVAFGQYVGFMVAVALWMSMILASASVANVFIDSLAQMLPVVGAPVARTAIIVVLYAALALINIRGVKLGSGIVQTVTAGKLVPILVLIVFGAFAINGANLAWPGMPSASDTARTTVILIFAFMGVESALTPSGEVKNPAVTVPRSIFAALAITTILYIALQVVTQGILGVELATNTQAPLAAAAKRVLGRAGELLVLFGAMISTFGYVAGDMLAAPRMPYSLGRDALLPRFLGVIHERYRTPYVAIVMHAVLCAVLAITGTFASLAVLVVLLTLLVYLACCLATIELQRRNVRTDGAVPFKVPGGPVIPILASAIILWLMSSSTRQEFMALAAMLAVSTVVYFIMRPQYPGRAKRESDQRPSSPDAEAKAQGSQSRQVVVSPRKPHMNDRSSTEQQDSAPGADDLQRQKITTTTRVLGIVVLVIGLLVAFVVPAALTQQGEQQAESSVNDFSRGGSAAGAAFEGVLRREIHAKARQNAEEARNLGFIVVIAGVAILSLARNATLMDFLAKQQMKR